MLALVKRRLERLEAVASARTPTPTLALLKRDPTAALSRAGLPADPWQRRVLSDPAPRRLLLCSRQSGKSTVAAAVGVNELLLSPPALVLLLSPTLRQSAELFRKAVRLLDALAWPVRPLARTTTSLELANGSRLVSLPDNEEGVRSFSAVRLLVLDEAARIPDALYRAVRPMLAVSRGRLLGLSTPWGQRGWFYDEWEKGGNRWDRVRVPAAACPRISAGFLAEELADLGQTWFDQEYNLVFRACEGAAFDPALIDAAFAPVAGETFVGSPL